jgi:hypothetical protein
MPLLLFSLSAWTVSQGFFITTTSESWRKDYFLLSSIVFLLSGIIFIWTLIQKRQQIEHIMNIFQLATDILKANASLFLLSFGLLVCYVVYSLIWLIALSCLFYSQTSKLNVNLSNTLSYELLTFYLFMYFWTSSVFFSIEKTTISGVVGDWYFHE